MTRKTKNPVAFLCFTWLTAALCGLPALAQDEEPAPPSQEPPAASTVLGVRGTEDGLAIEVVWGEDVGPYAELSLSDAQGAVLGLADAQPRAGEQSVISMPVAASDLTSAWQFDLVLGDHQVKKLFVVNMGLDCGDKRTCAATFEVGRSRSNAVSLSAELEQALTMASKRSDGRSNLVDEVGDLDPSLRGEAIRFGDEIARKSSRRSDCECYWTQNGPQGFKLPNPANNLLAFPSGETTAFGLEGPGAVLGNGAYHHGRRFTGTRDLTTEAEGSTLRKVDLDCYRVIAYETIYIELDLNEDGIIDIIVEVEVPSKWGPCENRACTEAPVDVLAQGATHAYSYAWDRGLFVTAEAWADAWLDLTLQGSNVMSLHAASHARNRDDELDIDEDIHFSTEATPVCLEFEADSRSRVRGRARDVNLAYAATSYSYALYGNKACVQNSPLISFEVADYVDFTTDFCNNIDTFYASNGETVTCP